MELGLPLALRLVQRVCAQGARQVGWRRTRGRSGNIHGGGRECRRIQGECRRARRTVERASGKYAKRRKTRGRMRGQRRMAGREGWGEEKMTGRQGDRKDQKREDPWVGGEKRRDRNG